MLREGEKVWINGGGPHPGILIRLSRDSKFGLILTGTGTQGREVPFVRVDPKKRLGAPLRLTKVTYFYQDALVVRHVDDFKPDDLPALCPIVIWFQLYALAIARVRENPRSLPMLDEWSSVLKT